MKWRTGVFISVFFFPKSIIETHNTAITLQSMDEYLTLNITLLAVLSHGAVCS